MNRWGITLFSIRTTKHVWIAAFVGAVIASVASAILIYLTLPPDRAVDGAIRAVICAAIVSFPMVAAMAQKIRQIRDLSQKLQYHIDFDRLTDVASRESFFERLALSNDFPGAVLMVDIDRFKSINDTYGHLAGDAVIRRVAQCVDRNTRASDIVARFGGEEFVVFIGGVDAELGVQVAERLRRSVDSAGVTLEGDVQVAPTVSIGVAGITAPERVDAAIRAADEALYRAKNGGRNAVCSAETVGAAQMEGMQPGARPRSTSTRQKDRPIHA